MINSALDEVRNDAVRNANAIYKETERKLLESIEISNEALEKAEIELEEAESSVAFHS